VILHVLEHDIFQREGDDLLCEGATQSRPGGAGGGVGGVPTLSGKASIKVPAGDAVGHGVFRLKGKGVRNVQGYGQGDLHVRVTVEIPSRLNMSSGRSWRSL